MEIIARIHTDFPTKFGIPRQSGLIDDLEGTIVFEPPYRNADALRGLEGFSHIWLIWQFSQSLREGWSATVRPPRLGGNTRMGVFATRSPFRPNPIGLSCVRISSIDLNTENGPVITVRGADLMDNTPIYDIKPYLPQADCHPDALGGFSAPVLDYALEVDFPAPLLECLPEVKRSAAIQMLSQDPRPGYRREDERPFGVEFAGHDIRFTVSEGRLSVHEIVPLKALKGT